MSVVDKFLKDTYPIASAIVGTGSAYFLIGEFPEIIFFGSPETQTMIQFVVAMIIGLSIYEGVNR